VTFSLIDGTHALSKENDSIYKSFQPYIPYFDFKDIGIMPLAGNVAEELERELH